MPTFQEIQKALENAMFAEPPKAFVLSKDSSALADVFAEMQFLHEQKREYDKLNEKQKSAFERWKSADTQP